YGSELGRIQRLLWASPALQFEPAENAETAIIDRAAAAAQSGVADPAATGSLLATMLYRPAHEVGLDIHWPAVQPWLARDLLAWSVAPVAGFRQLGEGERYANHLETLVTGIHRGALSDPGNSFWGELA